LKNMIKVDRRFLRRHPLPLPEAYTDKNRRGRVFMVGGGESAPGGILLAATAALRAGAGKVQVGVPRSIATTLGLVAPEFGTVRFTGTASGDPAAHSPLPLKKILRQADAALLGPGLSDASNALQLSLRAIRVALYPLVIDAAAITGLWRHARAVRQSAAQIVITPHHGEMAALMGRSERMIANNPHRAALEAAIHLDCTVVLKGVDTLIVSPHGDTLAYRGGVAGLATAGSGDVLAGILTGLLARGARPMAASAWAVYAHAAAGALLTRSVGPLGFLSREIPPLIPKLLQLSIAAKKTRT
jgi:hydroxyethylthiazole kinase-like uncharacterized protein yjeF